MTHSPEPWERNYDFGDTVIRDANGEVVICELEDAPRGEADAERLVACVNALAGVPSHVLRRADCPHSLLHALADYLGMEVQPKTQEEEDRASW